MLIYSENNNRNHAVEYKCVLSFYKKYNSVCFRLISFEFSSLFIIIFSLYPVCINSFDRLMVHSLEIFQRILSINRCLITFKNLN